MDVLTEPDAIESLVSELARLPGVGEKTARRFAFHILNAPQTYARDLAAAVIAIRERVHLCRICCNVTETDPCKLCSSAHRDQGLICVVERPTDVLSIERTGEFRGAYHVLHGVISPLDGVGPEDIKVRELVLRLQGEHEVREVIAATNPSVNGEATAMYVQKLLEPLGVLVTRIAQGLPMGSDIEFADKVTLSRALAGRRPL